MSKGYNPNPNSRKIYSSIKTQIRLLINKYKSDKNAIPVFETTKTRFEILRQVAFDLAVRNPNLHFQVFDDRCCCIVTQHIPLKEAFSYTWVKQSEVSGKWLVMAVPPGATRIDSLTVWIKEEDARKVALRILNKIRNFPLYEWDKQHQSKYYIKFLRSLPDDEDSIVGITTPGSTKIFDVEAQNTLQVYFKKLQNSEITREEFLQKTSEISSSMKK